MTKYNYDGIKALANKLGRRASTLIALAPDNDPFYILPFRQEAAMWYADLWERLGTGAGTALPAIPLSVNFSKNSHASSQWSPLQKYD